MRLRTEPDERSIAVLWNLLLAYPLDENRVRRVPEEVHGLIGEWRPWLQGRPGWSFDTPDEER